MSNFLPNALIKRLGTNPKFDQEAFIAAHRDGEKLTSIRLNPNKEAKLSLPLAGQVPWCSYGFVLITIIISAKYILTYGRMTGVRAEFKWPEFCPTFFLLDH